MCIGKSLLFNSFTGPHNSGCVFLTSNLFATWLYATHLSNILACKNFSVSIQCVCSEQSITFKLRTVLLAYQCLLVQIYSHLPMKGKHT